ncbi:MAG TPA: hypothetical protein VGN37_08585, partial [Actinocatenispora sp.]
DLGAGTATLTFFHLLGGAAGLSVLGTVFAALTAGSTGAAAATAVVFAIMALVAAVALVAVLLIAEQPLPVAEPVPVSSTTTPRRAGTRTPTPPRRAGSS